MPAVSILRLFHNNNTTYVAQSNPPGPCTYKLLFRQHSALSDFMFSCSKSSILRFFEKPCVVFAKAFCSGSTAALIDLSSQTLNVALEKQVRYQKIFSQISFWRPHFVISVTPTNVSFAHANVKSFPNRKIEINSISWKYLQNIQ